MRVLGLGSDLTNITRIEASLERFGARFIQRIFTPVEIERCESRPLLRAASYAKRFAAKEACAKALGTGLWRHGVHWHDMTVMNLPSGQPSLSLKGGAQAQLASLTPPGMIPDIALSLSDDFPWAQAMVLITAQLSP